MPEEAGQRDLIRLFSADRWYAHHYLFRERHRDESCEAHRQMVAAIYADEARVLVEGFRGFGKTTYLEESAVLRACLQEFHNMVILGASYTRACERLAVIKRELLHNPKITGTFGPQKGHPWTEGKIVLRSGIAIQAVGRDQALLGIKHGNWRPDAALVDDVEDPEEIRTDIERQATWDWFIKTFLPALDHPILTPVRVLGTRRGKGSLPERLENYGWRNAKFPIEYVDAGGERRATWPGKFPLAAIDEMMRDYRRDMTTWMQEYMCEATSEQDRTFGTIPVVPRVRTWEAVYAMIDPARTRGPASATTGWAVWSWISRHLVVWASGAEKILPDEIVSLCFAIAEGWNPIWIGIEEDGLNEWLRQPLRHEQARRGRMIPLKAVRAPRSKHDFIRGLQPFAQSGEIEFASEQPDLQTQLSGFPYGPIDAPNALAEALRMRPEPIYEFEPADHIAGDLAPIEGKPMFLALSASRICVAAALVQMSGQQLRVYADWMAEGDVATIAADIFAEASARSDTAARVEGRLGRDWSEVLKLPPRATTRRLALRCIVPPEHADMWNNVGLMQAIRRVPAGVGVGAKPEAGRQAIREKLRRMIGEPLVMVSENAAWTLRGFAGGYCRAVSRNGLAEFPEDGPYRLLMEAIESYAGVGQEREEEDDLQPVAYDRRGVPYKSAMPARRH